jgi:hypothetical protein
MIYEWKRCHVWSVVKITFLICGITGFIVGLFYAAVLVMLGGLLNTIGGPEFEQISGLFSGSFGFFMTFILAFTYAVVGAITAAILGWLYNVFARLVGGIRLTLEPVPETVSPQRIQPPPPAPRAPSPPPRTDGEPMI